MPKPPKAPTPTTSRVPSARPHDAVACTEARGGALCPHIVTRPADAVSAPPRARRRGEWKADRARVRRETRDLKRERAELAAEQQAAERLAERRAALAALNIDVPLDLPAIERAEGLVATGMTVTGGPLHVSALGPLELPHGGSITGGRDTAYEIPPPTRETT